MDPSSLVLADKEPDYQQTHLNLQATLNGTFPPPALVTSSHSDLATIIAGIVDIHIACVLVDGTLADFLPPFFPEKRTRVFDYWQQRFAEVANGLRHIIVQFAPTDIQYNSNTTQGSNSTSPTSIPPVVGVVMLKMPFSEDGPFRGLVEKLLVSPRYRHRGVARRMMAKLEEVARQAGRTNLMLDTPTESPANKVYPRLGYTELGVVPEYGYNPRDNKTLMDETFYWKDLRKSDPLLPHHQPRNVRS